MNVNSCYHSSTPLKGLTMTEQNPPRQMYRLPQYGGGIEELDRFALRDRIRNGEVSRATEIALKGSEEWRAAESFPELLRYFDLAGLKPAVAAGPMVAASKPRDVRPMSERVIHGLAYPIAGGEVFMLIGLALLSIVPFIAWLSAPAATLIMVSIVRSSANGKLKLPLVDTSNLFDLFWMWLRVMFITLVSLAPVLAFGTFVFWGLLTKTMPLPVAIAGAIVALAISAVYYPACLATVAVWDNVLASLNPVYVVKVIRTIGADYFIVIGMWFVATFATTFLQLPYIGNIPIIGPIFKSAVSYWALFYASHLLGYAVYRHAPELGWD